MNTNRLIQTVLAAMAMMLVTDLRAEEKEPATKQHEMKAYKGSPELERLKSLAGKWTGGMDGMKVQSEYTVVAGGSAVMERTFAGTPMEMVTLYHDKEGKLALTHYCVLHNRPHLMMTDSDANSISLDLDREGEVDQSESHMHSLVLTFVSQDEITQLWTHYLDGKRQKPHPMHFKRVSK